MEPKNFVYVVCDSENSSVGNFMRVYNTREMAEKARSNHQKKYANKLIIRCVPIDYID